MDDRENRWVFSNGLNFVSDCIFCSREGRVFQSVGDVFSTDRPPMVTNVLHK